MDMEMLPSGDVMIVYSDIESRHLVTATGSGSTWNLDIIENR